MTFQFDRSGGGFIIELANWNEPEYKTSWGKTIMLNKLTAHDLYKRQRIYPNTLTEENGKESWFRYDRTSILNFGNKYDKLSRKVIDRIPIMQKYWSEIKTE